MELKIEKGIFKNFELKEISNALEKGLSNNYESVKAEVIDCPNLRNWDCPSEGMSGNQRIIDVGGEPYMHDPKYLGTEFDYSDYLWDGQRDDFMKPYEKVNLPTPKNKR